MDADSTAPDPRRMARPGRLDVPPSIDLGRWASPLLEKGPEAAVDGRESATDQRHADKVLRIEALAQHDGTEENGRHLVQRAGRPVREASGPS